MDLEEEELLKETALAPREQDGQVFIREEMLDGATGAFASALVPTVIEEADDEI